MKKIIASASLAALGAASLQAAYVPGLSPQEKSKAWTISGNLRGFYDSNPTSSPKDEKQESWGFQFSPSLAVNLALDQTLIGFSYTYDMRYYEARVDNHADHSHHVNLKIDHAINERYKIEVGDTLNYAQEADLSQPIVSNPLRTDQNYLHNLGRLAFTAELTPVVGLVASYQNDYWDYDQEGNGSLSATLDRVEHLGNITARWQAMPNTIGLMSYQYGVISHTSDDSIVPNVPPPAAPAADTRDSTSHFVSVGAEQIFTSQFSGKAMLGAQFTDFPNALPTQDDRAVNPYADASASWTYNPGSYLQLGIRHQRNQTDVALGTAGTTPVQDQESTGIYGVVNHRIAPNFTGSLLGQYQYSSFRGGGLDGKVDMLAAFGVNFAYQVNAFVTAEAGYNFDRLDSDLAGRSFSRNRVYFGIRAAY